MLFKTISARELRPEDNKTISKDLESKFKAAGINLPKAFEIYVKEKGKEWDIIECIQPLQEGSSQHNTGVYKSIAKRISDDQALPNDKKSPSDPEITIPRSRIQAYHIEYRGDEYIITKKQSRAYRTTPLPTLRKDRRVKGQGNDELLAKLYSEICSSWRQLTEVRFKLLGLVPAVSIAILISLFARPKQGEGLSPTTQTVIAIFGLVITYALYIYERRNSELYDDLISRGRKIEAEMGIETGQFLGRKTPSAKTLFFLRVEHDTAIKAIYYTAIVIWLGAVVYIWRERLPSYLYDPIHHFLNV